MKKEINIEFFRQKYIEENLSISECAIFFNCGKSTIVRFCKENDIKKPKGLIYKNISKSAKIHDHNLVKRYYFEDNLTREQIAKKLNIKKGLCKIYDAGQRLFIK